jgi:hypothetical protein
MQVEFAPGSIDEVRKVIQNKTKYGLAVSSSEERIDYGY